MGASQSVPAPGRRTFSIEVSDPNSTLIFSFVGMVTQEFHLEGQKQILVNVKWDCNKDFFDSQQISIYANSGLINNPLGGQINLASPWVFGGVIKGSYSYQTNLDENEFQNAQIELGHYVSNCDFDMDFSWSYRQVLFNNDLNSKVNSLQTTLNIRNIKLIAGYTQLDFNRIETSKRNTSSGLLIGFGTSLGRPLYPTLIGEISFYKDNIEYQASIQGGYKRFLFFMKYYKLNSFNELSLGIGVSMYYKLKSQRKLTQHN